MKELLRLLNVRSGEDRLLGERFIVEGDPGDCLYVTVRGEVDIVVDGVGKVATRGERSVNGEMALLSSTARTASCVAATAVEALRIDRREFLELLRERPELGLGIIQVLARRLDEVSRKASARTDKPPRDTAS